MLQVLKKPYLIEYDSSKDTVLPERLKQLTISDLFNKLFNKKEGNRY